MADPQLNSLEIKFNGETISHLLFSFPIPPEALAYILNEVDETIYDYEPDWSEEDV